mmetsp:Transcript_8831/g.26551  ORF Transcript_8831/g.26551 Transcript_8831/m.26551 type:complete len:205 (-) Transcript_8831:35-649(-)
MCFLPFVKVGSSIHAKRGSRRTGAPSPSGVSSEYPNMVFRGCSSSKTMLQLESLIHSTFLGPNWPKWALISSVDIRSTPYRWRTFFLTASPTSASLRGSRKSPLTISSYCTSSSAGVSSGCILASIGASPPVGTLAGVSALTVATSPAAASEVVPPSSGPVSGAPPATCAVFSASLSILTSRSIVSLISKYACRAAPDSQLMQL